MQCEMVGTGAKICRNCGRSKVNRPRGLCWSCYYSPGVKDRFAWSSKIAQADIPNIAEEIESMGRSERRELISRLTVLLLHLLKWKYQPGLQGNIWKISIRGQRCRALGHLDENSSLKASLDEIMRVAYDDAVGDAELQTGLERGAFPAVCPWSFDQAMNADWLPE